MTTESTAEVALAVDIGGTKVDSALVTPAGVVLRGSNARRPTGRSSTREQIAGSIREAAAAALAALAPGHRLVGIGVGSAGPVDLPSGSISPLNLPTAAGLVITEVLAGLAPDVPVVLALDGTCIALAEHWLGELAGCANGLAMVVSTGVGGGFIANGRPVTGTTGNAGHIGQIRVRTRDADDPVASTLEAIAAGPGTVAWARSQGWDGSTGEELATAYRAGSPIAGACGRTFRIGRRRGDRHRDDALRPADRGHRRGFRQRRGRLHRSGPGVGAAVRLAPVRPGGTGDPLVTGRRRTAAGRRRVDPAALKRPAAVETARPGSRLQPAVAVRGRPIQLIVAYTAAATIMPAGRARSTPVSAATGPV